MSLLTIQNACKIWNDIAQGEVIGVVTDSEGYQGENITKHTFASSAIELCELPFISVPYHRYGYNSKDSFDRTPSKDDCEKVAAFLREMADKIEAAATWTSQHNKE